MAVKPIDPKMWERIQGLPSGFDFTNKKTGR